MPNVATPDQKIAQPRSESLVESYRVINNQDIFSASSRILTLASRFGTLSCECENQRPTSKYKRWWSLGFDSRFTSLRPGG